MSGAVCGRFVRSGGGGRWGAFGLAAGAPQLTSGAVPEGDGKRQQRRLAPMHLSVWIKRTGVLSPAGARGPDKPEHRLAEPPVTESQSNIINMAQRRTCSAVNTEVKTAGRPRYGGGRGSLAPASTAYLRRLVTVRKLPGSATREWHIQLLIESSALPAPSL